MIEPILAKIKPKHHISLVWLVPLCALLVGIILIVYHYYNRGTLIEIQFKSAEGVEVGVTKIKALSIDIGDVIETTFNDDVDGVVVKARIKKDARQLLRDDSRFWVVRPRVGAGGISGLGTLMSGAYIELSPGKSQQSKDEFVGLEDPPITPLDTPGIRLTLTTDRVGSVSVGNKIYFRGYAVGQVEEIRLAPQDRRVYCTVFIRAPYHELVTNTTKFWNESGFSLQTTASGVKFQTGTLETILMGGIAFDQAMGTQQGQPVAMNTVFDLYPDASSINEHHYKHGLTAILQFDDSIRGLTVGTPVEYRGIPLGTVTNIDTHTRLNDKFTSIPVEIRIEPARLGMEDTPQSVQYFRADLANLVARGLKATLKTGNLITGSLYVDLDYYPNMGRNRITFHEGYPVIPTYAGGLSQIEHKLTAIMDKIEALPLDKTVTRANTAIESANTTLLTVNQAAKNAGGTLNKADAAVKSITALSNSANGLLNDPATKNLPYQVNKTLSELDKTIKGLSPESSAYGNVNQSLDELTYLLKDIQPVVQTLKNKPNSLIFDSGTAPDPEPASKP